MKKIAAVAGAVSLGLLLIVLGGCATLMDGADQNVGFISTPAARIVVTADNGQILYDGTTPVTVKLPRKHTYVAEVSLPGYQTQTIPITHGFNARYLGNFLCGALVGLIIDPITGAMWNLQPNQVIVTLQTALNGTTKTTYVVFATVDEQGQVRTIAVPMTRI